MIPRDYQVRVLDEVFEWFNRHNEGHCIVDACVGAGKSLMLALLAQRAITTWPGTRIIVLAHQKELLEQNIEKLTACWPGADVGIFSAAVRKKQLGHALTYGTIGSIYKHAHELGRVDLLFCDECHLINPREAGMWRKFIADLTKYNPHLRVIGWTGTPYRGNGVWLTAGDDALFTGIAARVPMTELLELGYLSPLVVEETQAKIDVSTVGVQAGDYVIDQLAAASDRPDIVDATVSELCQRAANRRRWLVYCVTVEHAAHVQAALLERGIAAGLVTGTTPAAERDEIIRKMRVGALRCCVNVAVMTTGIDIPEVDCIALLRATKSPVLYVQIAGRGMRVIGGHISTSIERGKADALWLDFTDTTADLGPIDAIKGRMPRPKGKAPAPCKICPECGSQNPTATLKCVDCGFAFPEPERINHTDRATTAAVLTSQLPKQIVREVHDADYILHEKYGSPFPTMRVEYYGKGRLFVVAREWVTLSHEGFPRMRAETWWRSRARIDNIPGSVQEALEWLAYDKTILHVPSHVITMKDGKYDSIVGYHWNQPHANQQDKPADDAGAAPEGGEVPAIHQGQLQVV